MDTQKPITVNNFNHPTHLWIGEPEVLIAHTIITLQHFYCPQKGCKSCTTCVQIAQKKYFACIWLFPEKQYTLDQLEILFSTISFRSTHDQHVFFIIQKADFLTSMSANRLLKSLEEPPEGYHFILHAQRIDDIIPTIRSRCIIKKWPHTVKTKSNDKNICSFFTEKLSNKTAFEFLTTLEQAKINERETQEYLDEILLYWLIEYKKEHPLLPKQKIEQVITIISTEIKNPPMPGGSTLFWKNLYLHMMEYIA